MEFCQAEELLAGPVLVLAPHMDDEALGCGGTLAALPDGGRVHLAFATDGAGSPVPPAPWIGRPDPRLPGLRQEEARGAAAALGIPAANVHFFGLPDGRLSVHPEALSRAVDRLWDEVRPRHVLAPFRFDRHPDHLALHRAAWRRWTAREDGAELLEYFVYWRWRLLPRGDVRAYLRPEALAAVDVRPTAAAKRSALECYVTQTTRFYDWQARPNLTAELLEETSARPETFLRARRDLPGAAVFESWGSWIRLAHRLEPALKENKDRCLAIWRAARR